MLAVWGLSLIGLSLPMLRPHVSSDARAWVRGGGALFTGVAFGAAWTPCIGPVLGSILLYVTLEETMVQGGLLLVTYGIGLSIPFILLAMGLNWPLASSQRVDSWRGPLRRFAGGVLAVLGVALVTGYFAQLTTSLAGLGQLINLEL